MQRACTGFVAFARRVVRWRGNKGRTGAGKGEGYGPVIRILNCVASVHGVHSVHCTAAGR